MIKILRISASDAKYGGNVYESQVDSALNEFIVNVFFALAYIPKKLRYLFFPIFYILNFWKSNFNDADVVIMPLEAISLLSKKKKNIVIIHHIDHSFSSFLSSINQKLTYLLLFLNRERIDKIVVVSKFWHDYLLGKGFNDIQIIYNEVDRKLKCEAECSNLNFKVDGKLNIYIGNFHKKKGVTELLQLLKGDEYVLHTSGYAGPSVDGLINHSRLNYTDYLKLLSDVDVCITYSRFREGWCRTAHEALVLGTCVIGSGYGGMGELLNGAGQWIASDYLSLKKCLNQYYMKNINTEYVNSFGFDRFKKSWIQLVRSL